MNSKKTKICIRCKKHKNFEKDFYLSRGYWRRECKSCTIEKNVMYQKRTKPWEYRENDYEERRSYMLDYYKKNKSKYSEYRRRFKEKNPGYHKEYAQNKKQG